MNLKYFITAFTTFSSISIAQGAGFIAAQKLLQAMPSAFSPNERESDSLSKVFQTKFSCFDNDEPKLAVKLVPISSSAKRRGLGSRNKKGRPKLFTKSPMSF